MDLESTCVSEKVKNIIDYFNNKEYITLDELTEAVNSCSVVDNIAKNNYVFNKGGTYNGNVI